MAAQRRYLFPLASATRPIGGRNVILQMIDWLNEAGYEARAVYPYASAVYQFFPAKTPALYDKRLKSSFPKRAASGPAGPISRYLPEKRELLGRSIHSPADVRHDDVIVAPEFCYPELASVFPDNPLVVFVQSFVGLARALARDSSSARPVVDNAVELLGISEITERACSVLLGRPCSRLKLWIQEEDVGAVGSRRRRILYMPRRRAEDADLVIRMLRRSPDFAGYEIVALQGLTQKEVRREMARSSIFLSFSKQEGFGLPPAEAMLEGCLVVGFTGVGGNEFFTPDVAFPIEDGDLIGFVETVSRIVRDYERDPAELDAMRRRAAEKIRTRYSVAEARRVLLQRWAELDAGLSSGK